MSLLDKLLGALSQTCDFVFTWSMNFQAWGSTAVEEEKKKKKNRWVTQIPSSFEINTSNKINTNDHKQVAFVLWGL